MSEESSSRDPVSLPAYNTGDEGQPTHFIAATARDVAATEAKSLEVGDAAFIKRSDLKWTYAVVTEKVEQGESTILRFEVDIEKNRKSFPEPQWGKYIRVIKIEAEDLAKMKEEVAATKKVEEEAAEAVEKAEEETVAKVAEEEAVKAPEEKVEAEKPVEEAPKEEAQISSGASTGGGSTKSSKSNWFGGFFSGSSKKEEKAAEEAAPAAAEEAAAPAVEEAAAPAPEDTTAEPAKEDTASTEAIDKLKSVVAPAAEPMTEDPAAAALAATSFPTPAADDTSVQASVSKSVSKDSVSVLKESVAATPAPEAALEATPEAAPEAASAPEPNNVKENSDPVKEDDDSSKGSKGSKKDALPSLRTPLKLRPVLSLKKKGSIVKSMFSKNKDKAPATVEEGKKLVVVKTPSETAAALGDVKPKKRDDNKKEWFDPEALEVDYDKNPTDLFQALEARQFSYADEMYKQVNHQFNKECRTWVVARGQKKKDSAQLRFRALPLHAALVFGATDDMVIKILNAYPKATRGRDVKGRLPIHLAMEHNASEEVVSLLMEAFPKGMFAKDKKEMMPLDYVNNNMARSHQKKYIPLLTQAKVEEEHAKWEIEKGEALAAQRIALKTDVDYMEDVIATITEDVENNYASKMELLESNYQKEIQLLKKKHDSETQALLEGFEVKLNFERKLNKLKTKA